MSKPNSLSQSFFGSPILWGALASTGFYAAISYGALSGRFVERYFASHPVEYVATTMFFVGMAALVIKLLDLLFQYRGLSDPLLAPIPQGGHSVAECQALTDRLDQLPRARQNEHLARRLREAVEHVRRRGSAEMLDDHLKYLADLDAGRLHASYALVRVIIWAIPILGFLGTVIGITLAIANLAPEALEDSLPRVTSGLGVAFDTTALALALSIVLMFAQFLTDRAESTLLDRVDRQVDLEMLGRFEHLPSGPDGQLVAVRRMAETMLQATDQLVRRQTELWQASIEAAGQRWTRMTDTAGAQLQTALTGALSGSLKSHARELAAAEDAAAEKNRRHWQQVQQSLVRSAESAAAMQGTLTAQAEVLRRAVEATGDVAKLEESLNRNLAALAGAGNFEQTVISLAAAIQLLNARLGQRPVDVPNVQLQPGGGKGRAA